MDKDAVIAALKEANFVIKSEQRNGNGSGWRIELGTGAIVNCFDSGKINLQGVNVEPVRTALKLDQPKAANHGLGKSAAGPRNVFVVYGHDDNARTELEAMLRRWNLEPLILDQLTSAGQTIIEKLESVRKDAHFAVILATPDDEGNRKDHPEEKAFRARQNVVLELGMMLTLLGRSRVAILVKSDVKMERPSDIQGLIYIPYKEKVSDAKLTLAKEINAQGITINLDRV
jgi:predicted nucleotide-binding protein